MTQPAQPLLAYLTMAPWRHLLAIMGTHALSTSTRQTKAELITRLRQHLGEPQVLAHTITQLDAVGKGAMRALLTNGGALPVSTFEQRFGPVRPYRPWRKGAEEGGTQPWLAPISTTETLWYLGLIFHDPPKPQPGVVQHYVIPADCLPRLAPLLPTAATDQTAYTPLPRPGQPADLLVHLGIWLAAVTAAAVTPLHGRWLPPRLVAALAQRTGLDQAPDFRPERSERYLPYLAFLHYLAEAAELAAGAERLAITPAGWRWLALPPAERWRTLWQSWVAAPVEQADPYRFPWRRLTPQSRRQLLNALRSLPLDRFFSLADQLALWRLQDARGLLPAPQPISHWWDDDGPDPNAGPNADPAVQPSPRHVADPVADFCTGPLCWLGLLDVATSVDAAGPAIRLTPHGAWLLRDEAWRAPVAVTVYATMPKSTPDTLLLPVPASPHHLARLAPLCQWITPADGATTPLAVAQTLILDEARVGQAVAQGLHPNQILQYLADALGHPPSRRLRQRLQRWADQGQQVRLRPLLVLETTSAEVLTTLQRYQLIRRRLDETLGPRHAALSPTAVPGLIQTLQTLGFYCVAPPASAAVDLTATVATDANLPPAFQWLLYTLYRGLGAYLPLPTNVPWDDGRALAARLTPMQRAAAESAAADLLADLHASLDGYLRLPAWQMAQFPTAATLALLHQAVADHQTVELRYWSVSSGGPTLRRVTPQRIEEQAGIPYLHAYCHLRQSERVFRVDRIEAVVRSPESRVQSPKSRVRSPESRVQSPESEVQSP